MGSMTLCLLKSLRGFAKGILPLCSTGNTVIHHGGIITQEEVNGEVLGRSNCNSVITGHPFEFPMEVSLENGACEALRTTNTEKDLSLTPAPHCTWGSAGHWQTAKLLLTENKVLGIHMTIENEDNDQIPLILKALLAYIYPAII